MSNSKRDASGISTSFAIASGLVVAISLIVVLIATGGPWRGIAILSACAIPQAGWVIVALMDRRNDKRENYK